MYRQHSIIIVNDKRDDVTIFGLCMEGALLDCHNWQRLHTASQHTLDLGRHNGLVLLMHELLHVVRAKSILASRATRFPPTK
jgi:hypothetical protein